MTGYEVARRLQDDGNERPLLVAITGYGQQDDAARSHAAGFDHHLVKPVDFETLKQILSTSEPRRAASVDRL
jgi:CheY-like chemotaxis protein